MKQFLESVQIKRSQSYHHPNLNGLDLGKEGLRMAYLRSTMQGSARLSSVRLEALDAITTPTAFTTPTTLTTHIAFTIPNSFTIPTAFTIPQLSNPLQLVVVVAAKVTGVHLPLRFSNVSLGVPSRDVRLIDGCGPAQGNVGGFRAGTFSEGATSLRIHAALRQRLIIHTIITKPRTTR